MRIISTDPERFAGFTNDPAETEAWCAWIRFGRRFFFVHPPGNGTNSACQRKRWHVCTLRSEF